MARLFWVALGAAGAVVAAERTRRLARRYTPAGVSEQVEAVGRRTTGALQDAFTEFRSAMATREKDLVATLLVTPEGGDAGAVLRRRAARDDDAWPAEAVDDPTHRSRPRGRVDDDDSPYDF